MSKNYYYVLTFNVANLTVRRLLDRCHMLETAESMVDFTIRSKFFSSIVEATGAANNDFLKKIKFLFPKIAAEAPDDILKNVRTFAIYNPAYSASNEFLQQVLEKFGGNDGGNWEPSCCATLFFCESSDTTEEGMVPDTWLFKYEIYTVEDAIEIPRNGEQVFRPATLNEYH